MKNISESDKRFVEGVARWRTSTPEQERIAELESKLEHTGTNEQLQKIIDKLNHNGGEYNYMIYVGKNYSKADLVKELRELQEKK